MSGDQTKGTTSFSITEPRFDKNTYWGRVASIAAGVKPQNAFMTKAQIASMQKLLSEQKQKEAEQFQKTGSYKMEITEELKEQLCTADDVVGSAVHPDTN